VCQAGDCREPVSVRGEGYSDFIPLFTTALNVNPETVIRKYKERTSFEQTIKELKSYLKIERNHYTKKGSNYGYIFMLCLVYNFIQHLRRYLVDMSFIDFLDALSTYLLRKYPKMFISFENACEAMLKDIGCKRFNKTNNSLPESIPLSGKVTS